MTARALGLILKRCMDILIIALGLLAISPLLLLLSVLVYVYHGWHIFFTQERPGLQGNIFKMVKFRTMTNARDDCGKLIPVAERFKPFGQLISRICILAL